MSSSVNITSKRTATMTDAQDLVCVYNATNATKAELVRTLLESEGIHAVSGDTSNPFPGLSISPIEVYVQRTNEVAALSIIETINEGDLHTESVDGLADTDDEIPTPSLDQ
eukprot:TRINITY_DN47996_c0_g1_i1.p2 TRINITY_DN47996_c0_g1~~TRINITY_DN47996_c0_g1_i1.p2  ORF type:complete len:111 (-),score=12.56 TRINITY_DN47996_c0_g1_i1:562-894(-)